MVTLQEFSEAFRQDRSVVEGIQRFEDQIKREQTQVSELQRLGEERQKRQLEQALEENEKRWRKELLRWDHQLAEQSQHNKQVADQFRQLEARIAQHQTEIVATWKFLESQIAYQTQESRRWLGEMTRLLEERPKKSRGRLLPPLAGGKPAPSPGGTVRVIGTAGHVDHGKSTLVRALTGIDPDRLKEEKEREMTIDLGFAWLVLPSGERVGIVDVPGHKDFVKNMLAGVGGIDAALFVVAADEGVMPQTREHLAILDLLQVRGGVVALTKVDAVDERDWLDLVEADLLDVLEGTVLDGASIVRCSARSGEGLERLAVELDQYLASSAPRRDLGRPRLPVDRVFSMAGFGTVVTGTLSDGTLTVGQEVEISPRAPGPASGATDPQTKDRTSRARQSRGGKPDRVEPR